MRRRWRSASKRALQAQQVQRAQQAQQSKTRALGESPPAPAFNKSIHGGHAQKLSPSDDSGDDDGGEDGGSNAENSPMASSLAPALNKSIYRGRAQKFSPSEVLRVKKKIPITIEDSSNSDEEAGGFGEDNKEPERYSKKQPFSSSKKRRRVTRCSLLRVSTKELAGRQIRRNRRTENPRLTFYQDY